MLYFKDSIDLSENGLNPLDYGRVPIRDRERKRIECLEEN